MDRPRIRWGVLAGGSLLLGGALASRVGYRPEDLGPPGPPPPALERDQLRAVTLNAWRLANPARVTKLVDGLERSAELLATGSAARLPEIFAIQEIESREAADALRDAVAPTHDLLSCECAHEKDGTLRSAVAIGIARDRLTLEGESCVELGRIWPDHPRCALRADVRTSDGEPLTIVAVHMAWHIENDPMARRLVDALPADRPLLVLGDFNTWPGRKAYDTLTRGRLRDACEGAPPTTPIARRVDFVLASDEIAIDGRLDRRRAFDAMGVESFLRWPVLRHTFRGPHSRSDADDCPVTDHLPEGVVLRLAT
ncbi:MAG: endonuclease/exonuclease/phosphatase family protein [Sandaracinaceae bacterium]